MEEKIVILGNGFDLRHFLPTSYNHLISILCEIEKLPEKESISFSDLFGKAFKEKNEWFYQKINEYYQTENFKFDYEAIRSIQISLKDNYWFQYFKLVDENKIETWIDFETEIERILISVLEYFESFNKSEFKKPRYGGSNGKAIFFVPIALEKEHFKSKLQISLLKSFGLFQEADHNLNVQEKFILNIGNEIQYYKEKEFFNSLYKSLEEFIGIFNDYILYIIDIFYQNFRSDLRENFLQKDLNFLFDNIDKIYSFNYTNTYSKLYNIDKNNKDQYISRAFKLVTNEKTIGDIDFVHGKANKNWNGNIDNLKIVLGVDDIHDSLKKHKLFQFTKYFQKLHKQTDYLFLKDFEYTNGTKLGDRYTFYFWGHSLDYSDRQYIREIFDLVENSDGSKIKIERFMKFNILEFIESTSENLFKEL